MNESQVISCNNCGAPLDIQEGQLVVTCVYCNVRTKVTNQKEKFEHYMLPVEYNVEQIRLELIGDLFKYPGTPENLHENLKFTKINLKYYPYWIITVHNRTEYAGKGRYATYSGRYKSGYRNIRFHLKPEQGVFDDKREFKIYAAEEIEDELLDFEISTRSKRYFQKSEADKVKAEIAGSILKADQAKEQAINVMRNMHKGLVLKEIEVIEQLRDNPAIEGAYLLHIPFYFIEYSVGTRNYKAILGASTGRTVFTQIPRKKTYWAQVIVLSIIFGTMTILGGFFVINDPGMLFNLALYTGIVGLVFTVRTLVSGIRLAYREEAT